jgi:hypothetical protein
MLIDQGSPLFSLAMGLALSGTGFLVSFYEEDILPFLGRSLNLFDERYQS